MKIRCRESIGALAIACCASAVGCSTADGGDSRPNVIFIVLDDAGYNDFGFMGCDDLQTPNIDRLASDGVIFTDGHVSATVSGPSRAGILTGRYQQRFGYECNLEGDWGMDTAEITMGDIFREAGYTTACVGKWHQGNAAKYHPNRRGFDNFYGFVSGGRSYFYRPNKEDVPGDSHNLELDGVQQHFDGYLTDVLAQGATEYISTFAKAENPFMLYLAFNAVHTPMEASEEDLARYEGHPRQTLAAMTWAVDRGIGQVIDQLKQEGIYDNTLIFFISDNGGAHNNQSNNYPLKGFKGNKFEGGHRVPFFMTYGDRYKGRKYNGLISALDMLPTAADLAGIDVSQLDRKLDGVSLLPYLNGEKSGEPHDILCWRKDEMAAIRMGDYKLIRVEEVGTRLYNIEESLKEEEDKQHSHPEVYEQLSRNLVEWESGLITPPLWNEGVWNLVTRQIHRDLMNNKKVSCFTPAEYNKLKNNK